MQTAVLVIFVSLTSVAESASGDPQVKLGFLQHEVHASKTHASKRVKGDEADDAAPLIPQILLEDGQLPEGGVSPIPRDAVRWKDESDLPPFFQYLLAGIWILMLASIPFIMPIIDHKPVTKTQITVGTMMLLVLFGGFYLFTNIILFQSVHFKTIRPLTVVECIYFMSQVITTVGYGDVTPAKIRGQVFVGLYVLGALFIIAMLISDLTNHMVVMAKEYRQRLAAEKRRKRDEEAAKEGKERTAAHHYSVAELVEPEKPSTQALIVSLAAFAVIDIIWVAFFSTYPGEGKTVFQCVYMSVITLSTVGFGWFTPVTEPGMVFGAFFMIFGSGALVNVISNFTELMVKLNEWERFKPENKTAVLGELKEINGGKDQVTEQQFLQFTLLQMKCVNKKDLEHIREAFVALSPNKSGTVSLKAIEDSLAVTPPSSDAK